MKSATRVVISTFGTLAGLMGIEHGTGGIWQGNVAPEGVVFNSWEGSELFEILAGEPAMTVVPNLLVTGILACIFSLAFLVWATRFVERKHGGLVLLLIAVLMLLFGAGFGPPMLGLIVGATAVRFNALRHGRASGLPAGLRQSLGRLWPWSFGACLPAWLLLFPGSILLDHFLTVDGLILIPAVFFFALGSLLLTILAGFAYDSQEERVTKNYAYSF